MKEKFRDFSFTALCCPAFVDSMSCQKSPGTFLSRHLFCAALVDCMSCKNSPVAFLSRHFFAVFCFYHAP